jgi:hypothetical protein
MGPSDPSINKRVLVKALAAMLMGPSLTAFSRLIMTAAEIPTVSFCSTAKIWIVQNQRVVSHQRDPCLALGFMTFDQLLTESLRSITMDSGEPII